MSLGVAAAPGSRSLHGPSARRQRGVLALSLVLFAVVLVTLHVRAYTRLSPIDELQHFDYAERVSRGELPRPGDRIGEAAMREEACRRIDANFYPPACDSPVLRPSDFQEDGFATSAGQMPIYFAVTGSIGRILRPLVGAHSLLTGMRLVGGLWLGAGLVLLWAALRTAGVVRSITAAVVVLVACTPVVLQATAVLNPDAQLLPGGALLVLLALRVRDRRHVIVLGLAAAVAVFLEQTLLLAAFAVVTDFGVRAFDSGLGDARRASRASTFLVACAATLAGAAVGLVAAATVASLIGGSDPGLAVPKNRAFHVEHVPTAEIAAQLSALVTPVRAVALAAPLRSWPADLARRATNLGLLVALAGAALFRGRTARRTRALAVATLSVMALGGPALAFQTAVFGKSFFPIPPRYGLPLLPAAAVVLGGSVRHRTTEVALLGLALWALIATVWALATG
jgi:hypothetical protein